MVDLPSALRAARETALLVPSPEYGVLVVTGKDRVSWLNGLVTCDLSKLRPGEGAYGLAVTQKGRIIADLTIVLDEERALVVALGSKIEELRASFDHYLIMEDAELAAETDAFEVSFMHGPRAGEVLERIRASGVLGAPLDRTGRGGAVFLAERPQREKIDASFDDVLGAVGGVRGDAAAWEVLCLEEGVPRFGIDFGPTTYPQEAGLERTAVSFQKGCYLGQEVICMLEMRGQVKRRLVQLAIDAETAPAPQTFLVDADGARLGEITSALPSPSEAGTVHALAMLKRPYAEPGKVLDVGGARARVTKIV